MARIAGILPTDTAMPKTTEPTMATVTAEHSDVPSQAKQLAVADIRLGLSSGLENLVAEEGVVEELGNSALEARIGGRCRRSRPNWEHIAHKQAGKCSHIRFRFLQTPNQPKTLLKLTTRDTAKSKAKQIEKNQRLSKHFLKK